jgi:glyoxylase-like metal-dependent hydrolase (beta-lactamase superfamily II)
MSAKTELFPCLSDNYGVLLHDPSTGSTATIDAPEAAPVEAALKRTGWKLSHILVTHHHADHTAGIPELKERHHCRVVAPRREAERIPLVDVSVGEGDSVEVGKLSAKVIETPGHTGGHIAYWFAADKLAFVGDTLFSIGCGRVIEGTPEMMWQSLVKLRDLPGDTKVYCGRRRPQIRSCAPICPRWPSWSVWQGLRRRRSSPKFAHARTGSRGGGRGHERHAGPEVLEPIRRTARGAGRRHRRRSSASGGRPDASLRYRRRQHRDFRPARKAGAGR